MEKVQEPLYHEESPAVIPHSTAKRPFTFVHRAVITALLLISGLVLFLSESPRVGCTRKLTINERAEKILKHTPLIG
jgi:hypothetical protein